jgi:hypothetical protein
MEHNADARKGRAGFDDITKAPNPTSSASLLCMDREISLHGCT